MSLPGFLIAAPRSGAGKTTVTLGLLRALARAGVAVQPYKCGPDYIDPAFHAVAAGRASYNLDLWAMGPERVSALVAATGAGADLVVAEGVMGLFDGAAAEGPHGRGASADVAARMCWPVVLVLDVSGQTETAAAVAMGLARWRDDVRVAGVILNRVASARHEALVRAGFARTGLPVFGVLARRDGLSLPERHLGLVQAGETADLDARLDAIADAVVAGVDLAAVRAAADDSVALAYSPSPRSAAATRGEGERSVGGMRASSPSPRLRGEGRGEGQELAPTVAGRGYETLADDGTGTRADVVPQAAPHPAPSPRSAAATRGEGEFRSDPAAARGEGDVSAFAAAARDAGGAFLSPPGQRIALARDAAFSFMYPHVLLGWRRAGAEIVPFSPLADEAPDAAADAVWLPGGYPELYAGLLATAQCFRDGMQRAAARGAVIHGECGGYMALGAGIEDADGVHHAMLGLLGLETSFAKRRLHLGYRRARLLAEGGLGPAGTRLVGHEFHYASVVASPDDPLADVRDAAGETVAEAGSRRGRVTGTFFHAVATSEG